MSTPLIKKLLGRKPSVKIPVPIAEDGVEQSIRPRSADKLGCNLMVVGTESVGKTGNLCVCAQVKQ